MSQIIRDMTEITRCGVQYRTDKLSPMGLKACHASYLTEICRNPGISQDQLAKRICLNKSNVARQIASLEDDGFVRRCTCAGDKRAMELYPTEKTLALLPEIEKILACWENFLTQELTPEETEVLTSVLAKMKTRASSWMEDK